MRCPDFRCLIGGVLNGVLSMSPSSEQHSSTEYENVDDMQTERYDVLYDVHVHVHVDY